MVKTQPVSVTSLITSADISAWYQRNPFPLTSSDAVMPLERTLEDSWKTISNASYMLNEAADPISTNSTIPVAGREGFKTIMGGFVTFGKGKEMDSKQIQEFERLKVQFASLKNQEAAKQLTDYYGGDLAYVRTAVQAEKTYLTYALLSSACNIGFVAANSPYMQGITSMDYAVESWQKDAVTTSWANAAAPILDDIKSAIDEAEAHGKVITKIKINKTWFDYVRANTQIQKYCATLVQNLYSVQSLPTLEAINTMMLGHFGQDIAFEVVTDRITRVGLNGTKTTANPFADGVAVFTAATQVGRFMWTPIYVNDPTRETPESFFIAGNYKNVDPDYSKIYSKAKAFPVVDTYADNFYLKINAIAW